MNMLKNQNKPADIPSHPAPPLVKTTEKTNAAPKSKKTQIELLSDRSEIFRSKLIGNFHLLEAFTSTGKRIDGPVYQTPDLENTLRFNESLKENPDGLMRFHIFHVSKAHISKGTRQIRRFENVSSSFPAINLWARWVVRSSSFQNVILACILVNLVGLGIEAEIADRDPNSFSTMVLVLEILDNCVLFLFSLEIVLKWLDNFRSFWTSAWNVFDFAVTFFSLIPAVISLFSGQPPTNRESSGDSTASILQRFAGNLRTFRILRSLKLLYRFSNLKIIILAVTKAIQAMLSITLLLVVIAYIFAIVGVTFFNQNYRKAKDRLNFPSSFTSIPNALITLFQVFTLDRWSSVYADVVNATGYVIYGFYVILWVLIGGYIFRNLFVGIMVNNFTGIRKDLAKEMAQAKQEEKERRVMTALAEELEFTLQRKKVSLDNDAALQESEEANEEALNESDLSELAATHWESVVEQNLELIANQDVRFYWPKDTLFQYLLAMESLVENLKERERLLQLANEALLQLSDIP